MSVEKLEAFVREHPKHFSKAELADALDTSRQNITNWVIASEYLTCGSHRGALVDYDFELENIRRQQRHASNPIPQPVEPTISREELLQPRKKSVDSQVRRDVNSLVKEVRSSNSGSPRSTAPDPSIQGIDYESQLRKVMQALIPNADIQINFPILRLYANHLTGSALEQNVKHFPDGSIRDLVSSAVESAEVPIGAFKDVQQQLLIAYLMLDAANKSGGYKILHNLFHPDNLIDATISNKSTIGPDNSEAQKRINVDRELDAKMELWDETVGGTEGERYIAKEKYRAELYETNNVKVILPTPSHEELVAQTLAELNGDEFDWDKYSS